MLAPSWPRMPAVVGLLLLLLALAIMAWLARMQLRDARLQVGLQARLQARLDGVQPTRPAAQVDCARLRAAHPLVLLVLGQSNAGNHGEPTPGGSTAIWMMDAGVCSISADPLPGATGAGGSVWTWLPAGLAALGITRPVLIQLLAVDASSVDDWVRPASPLRQRLLASLAANATTGMAPDLVLWQQGETDARIRTPEARYVAKLKALAQLLTEKGISAPMVLALSTVCRTAPAKALRDAVRDLPRQDSHFRLGPDTDMLNVTLRRDGCHWSQAGRQQAAELWAAALSGGTALSDPMRRP